MPEEVSLNTLAERLKQYRKQGQWTLEQLSESSGVSRSMLSQIERGKANPTLAIACRIAKALNISIAELVEEPWTQPTIDVVRVGDLRSIMRDDQQGYVQMLSPQNAATTEFYYLRLPPDAELNSRPHFRGTKEILTVQSGCVLVISGSESCHLNSGDTACYQADQSHRIINQSREDAVLYMVVCLSEPKAGSYEWDMLEKP